MPLKLRLEDEDDKDAYDGWFINSAEEKSLKALGIRRSDLDPNVLGTLIKIDQKPSIFHFSISTGETDRKRE